MRNIFYWTALMVFSFKLNAQELLPISKKQVLKVENQREQIRNSKVLERICYTYKIANGNVTNESFVSEVVMYDKSGKPYEVRDLERGNKLQGISLLAYNSKGDNIEKKTYLPEGDVIKKTRISYTNRCATLLQEWDLMSNSERTITYKQDPVSNSIWVTSVIMTDSIEYKLEYSLENNLEGRFTSYKKYTSTNDLLFFTNYFYDDTLLVRKDFLTPDKNLAFFIEYKYDKNGFLKEERKYTPTHKQVYYLFFDYNESGLLNGFIKYGMSNNIEEYVKYKYKTY